MGAHSVVLELLQIPYEKVKPCYRKQNLMFTIAFTVHLYKNILTLLLYGRVRMSECRKS